MSMAGAVSPTEGVAYEDFVERFRVVEPRPRTLYVFDVRGRRRRLGAVFWAGALLIVSAFAALAVRGPSGFTGLDGAIVLTTWIGLGVVLVVRSRTRDPGTEIPLLWLDGSTRVLRVRQQAGQESLTDSAPIGFEEVDELLFASRRIAPPGSRARVDGAGVFIRLLDGAVWPVVPATLDAEGAYRLALGIASRVGVGVKQVGQGWTMA